jgi:hypothetical protein
VSLREKLIAALGVGLAAFIGALLSPKAPVPPPGVVIPPEVIVPPNPDGPPPPRPTGPNPAAALARITFGSAGCTATVIGPRRPDLRWDLLTAAHCITGVGQRGVARLPDGRVLAVRVQAVGRGPDWAWLVTEGPYDVLPYAELAPTVPPVGSKVWHAGYGVDRPGNREEGTFVGGPEANGQVRFRINVSSGDSGGGICLDDAGRVLSCVCCTRTPGRLADVWGAGPAAILAGRPPGTNVVDDWEPLPIPERMEGDNPD